MLLVRLVCMLLLLHGRWRRPLDLWCRDVWIDSAAQGGVAVGVVSHGGALERGRGGCSEGRSVSPHGALVEAGSAKARGGVGLRASVAGLWWGRGRGHGAGKSGRTRGRHGRRSGGGGGGEGRCGWALLLVVVVAYGCKRVTVGGRAGEVVERGWGLRSRGRGLAQETVFFSYIC